MREIKFRAWNTQLKKMFQWDDMCDAKTSYIFKWVNIQKEEPIVNILMQYTGLKDKNCVEIYEGDIVKAPKYERILQDELSQVSFQDGAFCLYTVEFEYHAKIPLCDVKIRNIEVIGNIYENPELLENKND